MDDILANGLSGPVLVTGGLGFIGSAVVRRLVAEGVDVVNVDAHTYAADEARLAGLTLPTLVFDVADPELIRLIHFVRPAAVIHLAAESHVTRSERAEDVFWRTNVDGTACVLEACAASGVKRVLHVSTDEVYGPCSGTPFREHDKVAGEGMATSAYARSKAIADDLARSFAERLDVVVVRPTNCYGPWQHPEKAIPRWTSRALRGETLPVWGDGRQVRDWMHVDDAVDGILLVLRKGARGEAYNIAPAAADEHNNAEVASIVARAATGSDDGVRLTAYDRPLHDRRYAVDAAKIRALGWEPAWNVNDGIGETVGWYRDHTDWWSALIPEAEGLYVDI